MPESTEYPDNKRLNVICRPASIKDTPYVMELTSKIWDGEDYVPVVWTEWLCDSTGELTVAECDNRVIGLGKLTRLSSADWWLEGLRVHPDFEGIGIAAQIHDYLLDIWLNQGRGKIRLATASFRHPIHHLCRRTGFKKIGEFMIFQITISEPDDINLKEQTFQLIPSSEINKSLDFALSSPMMPLSYGLMDLDWKWAPLRFSYFTDAVNRGMAFWWRNRNGVLVIRKSLEEKDESRLYLSLVVCQPDNIGPYFLDLLTYAQIKGYHKIDWITPLQPDLLLQLEEIGFKRTWDDSLYLYERAHPSMGFTD
ncbi:GNAT family N-acetyltransferase [Chloroflexota bacterium]